MMAQLFNLLIPKKIRGEEYQVATLLVSILGVGFVASLIIFLVGLGTKDYPSAYLAAGFLGVILLCLYLIRQGQTKWPGLLIPSGLLLAAHLRLLYGNGIHDVGLLVYPLIITFAALLLGKSGGVIFLLLCILSIIGIIHAEIQGLVNSGYSQLTEFTDLIPISVLMAANTGLVWITMDILSRSLRQTRHNERILAEKNQSLQESEERFRLVFEHSPEPILLLDPHDIKVPILDCNDAFLKMLMRPREEVVGKTIDDFQLEVEPEATRKEVLRTLLKGEVLEGEMSLVRKDGEPITVQYTSRLIVLHGRELILGIDRDITTQKQAEEKIRQINLDLEARVQERTEQLETAYRELEAFSYTISHDLRAPARGMTGFSQILLNEYASELPAQAQKFLSLINHNAHQMGELIDDLLSFIQLGRRVLDLQEVAPHLLAKQALEALPEIPDHRRVDIRIADMPSCYADPILLELIFFQLIDNALKYTDMRDHAQIEINYYPAETGPVYFVRDNGIGFDMKYANKLFGVFQRLHTTDKYEGTGVGLAMVQRIIHQHGGQVWAESEPGKGTTICFTLSRKLPDPLDRKLKT